MENKADLQRFAAAGAGTEESAPAAGAPETENKGSNAPETDACDRSTPEPRETADAAQGNAAPPAAAAPETPPETQAEAAQTERLLGSVSAALEAAGQANEAKRIAAAWEAEAAALKEIYPAFDLKREARENGEFARLLAAGVSVRRAWEAANLEAILGEAMRYAARTAGKKAAESLAAGAGRVQENSVLDRASSLGRRDVASLTKNDILKILDEVSRGAKITF